MKLEIDEVFNIDNKKPFIIAEMSGNHNQSLDRAKKIIDAAAEASADAIKFQTYTADTMTIQASHGLFQIDDESSLWEGYTLYELYEQAHTPWEWHKELFAYANERDIIPFSTPFDNTAVDFLEDLEVPFYKIGSFENTHHPLLKKVASTGKPVIMSTGLATVADLDESVRVLRDHGCEKLVLLKCTSSYPADASSSNLNTIPHLADLFECKVGLSDHTLGIGAPIAAVALGATVFEKHFTLNRSEGGVDADFSLEPQELKKLVEETNRACQALGNISYGIQESEKASLRFKQSVYVVKDVEKGQHFTSENTRVIRPGDGLPPKYYERILGKKAKENIETGTPLSWDLL
ncbi:N-acetylneuraminate synthase [Fodinibius roseus]|uniref:N-acetylneuraminate synthase n=1 Tax=Fodinibius roseus TaxID=1194090 RepID=A0A1M5J1W2_9BACT|nr:pseudaminic acid synthase [Fodinibius roseus]SHG34355.1 N-acetylneuraminate synthase [Fodinibius roseus]